MKPDGLATLELFQSLSGFFRPCNRSTQGKGKSGVWFQSLSGFFRPCNGTILLIAIGGAMFQSLSGFFRPCNKSSPNRKVASPLLFQSLSGFFRPCNEATARGPADDLARVSIPVGFFQALQLWSLGYSFGRRSRFNPCRVFSGLATKWVEEGEHYQRLCFNPCRVFSGLATPSPRSHFLHRSFRFNPCRVFSGLAT